MLKDFGRDLKELRESKNITIAEISAQTRINPKFIMNIESGIFDFQPDTYIRAFLKEYAKCINESEEQILNNYGKAKAGFYSKKKITDDHTVSIKPVEQSSRNIQISSTRAYADSEQLTDQSQKQKLPGAPAVSKFEDRESKEEFSNKTLTQKILLGLVIIIGVIGIFYLYKTLSNPEKKSADIKPKTFSEISEDYENKIKGKHEDTSSLNTNTVNDTGKDSLKLTIRASREVRVKIYVDEKRIVEEVIEPKDSLVVPAKQQYRFSASANSSIELFLNGKLLKKPSSLTNTSIKNLVINKDGITAQ